jgi:hypothetical protein
MGDGRSYDLKGRWKRGEDGLSKVALRVSEPQDLRGTSFLMIEQHGRPPDLFSYLPELEKVRRITMRAAAGQLFGSDFSYEDFQRIQNLARSANSKLRADTQVDGRTAWEIETIPGPEEGSEYTRIVSAIDQERCVPLQVKFYTGAEEPVKLLLVPAAKVHRQGDGWVPMELTMKDLDGDTHSVLIVKDVALDLDISDRDFTQSAMRRRR